MNKLICTIPMLLFTGLSVCTVVKGYGYGETNAVTASFPVSADQVTAMPIRLINGLPYVQISINGKGPWLFGFDSGFGAELEIDTELATELGIQPDGTTTIGDGSGNAGVTLQTGVVGTVQIGTDAFKNVTAIFRTNTRKNVPGMEQVKGIIGIAMFTKYLVTIDYPGLQLILEKGELPVQNDKDIFSYEPVGGGIPEIKIQVGSFTVPAVIDSRSMSAAFKIPQHIAEKLTCLTEPRVIGKGRTISSEINITEVKVKEEIRMGQYLYPEPVITYPSLNESAIIGSKLLRHFIITIDQQNRRVRMVKGKEQPVSSKLAGFTGKYAGGRTITAEGDFLFIQRLSGTPLKMLPTAPDEFTLELVKGSVLKFERDVQGVITALKVSRGDGSWETAVKE